MSTRCQIAFHTGDIAEHDALLYHHSDGYPSSQLKKIVAFLKKTDELLCRIDHHYWWDGERVAGFFVLLSAGVNKIPMIPDPKAFEIDSEEWIKLDPQTRHDTIGNRYPSYQPSVGLHCDIAYLYRVHLYEGESLGGRRHEPNTWKIEIYKVKGWENQSFDLLGTVDYNTDIDVWLKETLAEKQEVSFDVNPCG